MRRPSKYYAELFVRVSADVASRDLDTFTQSFIKLLAKENALSRLHEISRLISTTMDHALGTKDLTVTTAEPIKTSALHAFARAAKTEGFDQIKTVVDPELIGGAILRSGDRRIDQSVKGALARLYETLTS